MIDRSPGGERPRVGGDGADGVVRRSHAAAIPSGEEATTRTPAPPRSSAGAADSSGRLARAGALVLLVMQMVGLVMLMRYTRTQHPAGAAGSLYLASTAVLAMEAMKLAICLAMVARDAGGTAKGLADQLRTHVVASPGEVLRLSVPSLLYTVQNNLLYLALTNLDAATYQVCYQLKILTTAVFSALMLGRRFSTRKWAAIVLLTLGVIVVQLSGSGDSRGASVAAAAASTEDEDRTARERLVGLAAVLCAACTSGFSGVYFEKILKGSSTPLWIRNIQMGLPSVAIALITVFYKDSAAVFEAGFFQGYTPLVWLVVAVQAAGGLIVAVVVKLLDNVAKVFAASFGIVLTGVVSAVLFEFRPNLQFIVGTALVLCSTVIYSQPDQKPRRRRRRRRRHGGSKPILPTKGRISRSREAK